MSRFFLNQQSFRLSLLEPLLPFSPTTASFPFSVPISSHLNSFLMVPLFPSSTKVSLEMISSHVPRTISGSQLIFTRSASILTGLEKASAGLVFQLNLGLQHHQWALSFHRAREMHDAETLPHAGPGFRPQHLPSSLLRNLSSDSPARTVCFQKGGLHLT